METKDLRVNMDKTKLMVSGVVVGSGFVLCAKKVLGKIQSCDRWVCMADCRV